MGGTTWTFGTSSKKTRFKTRTFFSTKKSTAKVRRNKTPKNGKNGKVRKKNGRKNGKNGKKTAKSGKKTRAFPRKRFSRYFSKILQYAVQDAFFCRGVPYFPIYEGVHQHSIGVSSVF